MNPAKGQMNTKRKIKTKVSYNNHENESPGELNTDIFHRINLDIGNLKRQMKYSHAESRR